ncbi:monovalent cation/H(+) antiporter subunit G [Actinorugispora endophytica]|uniref:Multisubunit sodium/proton antiporter MrpG subunit n=1 Tax=Actinorugispora endophytica TaxID=1605990 RepID=A0A4R6UN73_9ACTN|nr:monovalent cation/H(+) antiporter subunit G [Actinorugispora endophytica]TDQ48242.1 multisubunit sodium/proton antiporter MrpG subunit [Actinorugispora endophytica]
MTAVDWVTAVLLTLGALFTLIGTIGLVRFPTLLGRMHAATKPDTVGLFLLLFGAAFQLPDLRSAAPLALVALFQMVTAPVLAQTVGRVAYSRGETDEEHLVVDELAEAVERARKDAPDDVDARDR